MNQKDLDAMAEAAAATWLKINQLPLADLARKPAVMAEIVRVSRGDDWVEVNQLGAELRICSRFGGRNFEHRAIHDDGDDDLLMSASSGLTPTLRRFDIDEFWAKGSLVAYKPLWLGRLKVPMAEPVEED